MAIKLATERLARVADVMSAIVGVVDESSTVEEARDALADLGVSGAPVMRGEQVVGVVSQTDLLRARNDLSVTEVMTETIYAVRPDDSVLLAVRLMVEQRIQRVIVVNDDGELHGILTSLDALGALAAAFGAGPDLGYVDLRGQNADA
ncbi:MAG: CBS domain-containing protein [Myxococcales bacterium]|nr:CBS domain-containing protein [Myxococcales bacterium]